MKRYISLCLLLTLCACSDVQEQTYPTYAIAKKAGAFKRGWVPQFVPKSATNIRDWHRMDTSAQRLEFTILPEDFSVMVAGMKSPAVDDNANAVALSRSLGFGGLSQTFLVCAKPLNGALVLDRNSGRSVYITPVAWVDDDCG
jgi:hypothetical protein